MVIVLLCLGCQLFDTRDEDEKTSWKPSYFIFKGLSLVLANYEINMLEFCIHSLANEADSGDSSLSAYEGVCPALMCHL